MKKLGTTEIEIMKVLWRQTEPVTSNFILDELRTYKELKLPSLMTSLTRLSEKGFVCCDRSTRTNYYTAVISEVEYRKSEGATFLEKVFDNSLPKLVASLYESKHLSDQDISDLKAYLDELTDETK